MIAIITIYIIISNNSNSANESNLIIQLENSVTTENNNENNNESNNAVSNLDDNETPKEIVSLLDIPTPDSIIFYHNGMKKTFVRGTDEFNEIIMLNNKRDSGKLGALQLVVDINGLLQNTDMLEYAYGNYGSVYFNLIKDEQLENDNQFWVSVGYDSKIFKRFIYDGLLPADDLINYVYTLK
jgi:hypothetical protein